MDALPDFGNVRVKGMDGIMRMALIGFAHLLLAGMAHAEFSADRVRAQLAAQGYEQIAFVEKDGQVTVTARRGKLLLLTVYDLATGEIISERVSQADAANGSQTATTVTEPESAADATEESVKGNVIVVRKGTSPQLGDVQEPAKGVALAPPKADDEVSETITGPSSATVDEAEAGTDKDKDNGDAGGDHTADAPDPTPEGGASDDAQAAPPETAPEAEASSDTTPQQDDASEAGVSTGADSAEAHSDPGEKGGEGDHGGERDHGDKGNKESESRDRGESAAPDDASQGEDSRETDSDTGDMTKG